MSADLSVRPHPSNPRPHDLLFGGPSAAGAAPAGAHQHDAPSSAVAPSSLSLFERIVTTHPPILESLLAQLPTASLLDLYHTSAYLRSFLSEYPLAWKTLSFRLPQPSAAASAVTGSPAAHGGASSTPDGRIERVSKMYALDALLVQIVVPFGNRLTSLDLDNTAVSGVRLVSRVLEPRVDTIRHLSVRGCKNVSIKYHLVPFLEPYVDKGSPWALKSDLALKSLYTYRCRHHRRRPYLPSSLARRDSDSEPTHQLIEICHQLSIWTDTAWCTTPGGRCSRRKEYYIGRAAPGTAEVWVPFDRLWRSGNRIGPSGHGPKAPSDGRLWEDSETGHDGEPLGTEDGPFAGEGKDIPAHLRKSHRTFVDNVKCDDCGDPILERCEQCSIRMHCMGCRKTLCASCAFNRPIPRKRKPRRFASQAFGDSNLLASINTENNTASASNPPDDQGRGTERRKRNKFWWAPGLSRSPNLMSEMNATVADYDEASSDEDSGSGDNAVDHFNPIQPINPLNALLRPTLPKLTMNWCCVEPVFSGGGGIVVLGPNVTGRGAERIRAAPLPRNRNYEDPSFSSAAALRRPDLVREMKNATLYEYVLGSDINILPYLQQESIELQNSTCPRSLCQDCYRSFRWRVPCRACKKPLCKEHDFRGLKVRKCGYRDLHTEREWVRSQPPVVRGDDVPGLKIPAWKGDARSSGEGNVAEAPGMVKEMSSGSIGSEAVFATDGQGVNHTQNNLTSPTFAGLTQELSPTPSPFPTTGILPGPQSLLQSPQQQPEMTASLSSLLQLQQPTPTSTVSPPQPPAHGVHFLPTGPSIPASRPRSLSSSEPRPSRSGSPWSAARSPANPGLFGTGSTNVFGMGSSNIRDRLPLPGHPRHPVQWQGCGSYFCQALRPVGDCRPRCNAQMRECGGCGVLVCDGCLIVNPPCPCAVCTASYHCPSCSTLPSVRALCRRQDELAAMLARDQKERERKRKEEDAKKIADEMAEAQREFFEGRDQWEAAVINSLEVEGDAQRLWETEGEVSGAEGVAGESCTGSEGMVGDVVEGMEGSEDLDQDMSTTAIPSSSVPQHEEAEADAEAEGQQPTSSSASTPGVEVSVEA